MPPDANPSFSHSALIDFFTHFHDDTITAFRPPMGLAQAPTILLCRLAAQGLALTIEVSGRAFERPDLPEAEIEHRVARAVCNPTATALADLYTEWRIKHPTLTHAQLFQAPAFLLVSRLNFDAIIRELCKRGQSLPVLSAWVRLGKRGEPNTPADINETQLFQVLNTVLGHTVKRSLRSTREQITIALLGASERYANGTEKLREILHAHPFPLLAIPVIGMETDSPDDQKWTTLAAGVARDLLAEIGPSYTGALELVLPDGAHAAQRAEREHADAKKLGGTGGHKAEMAGKAEPAAQHVPIGKSDEDAACIDPKDDRLNPEQELEAREEETTVKKDAEHAFRLAIDRWGSSGQRMLEALAEGKTDKEAAKAAGISAPALIKRRKTLKKLLKH